MANSSNAALNKHETQLDGAFTAICIIKSVIQSTHHDRKIQLKTD